MSCDFINSSDSPKITTSRYSKRTLCSTERKKNAEVELSDEDEYIHVCDSCRELLQLLNSSDSPKITTSRYSKRTLCSTERKKNAEVELSDEDEYVCDSCRELLQLQQRIKTDISTDYTREALQTHLYTNTGEKPYKCEQEI